MAKPIQIRGTLVARNLSPHGEWEGVLVDVDGDVVQVNLPKHGGKLPGDGQVELTVVKHDKRGKHLVYELAEAVAPVEGKIERFNYSRHGEVNGYHLDSGPMVHVKPDGARKAKLKIGDVIRASGELREGTDGTVVEAEAVAKVRKH